MTTWLVVLGVVLVALWRSLDRRRNPKSVPGVGAEVGGPPTMRELSEFAVSQLSKVDEVDRVRPATDGDTGALPSDHDRS